VRVPVYRTHRIGAAHAGDLVLLDMRRIALTPPMPVFTLPVMRKVLARQSTVRRRTMEALAADSKPSAHRTSCSTRGLRG
jgi:hypothetical protein